VEVVGQSCIPVFPLGRKPGSLFHVYRGKGDGTEQTVSTYEYDVQARVTCATSG